MRTSRIPRPPGSKYLIIHHYLVKQFGFAAAAVIGLLDFLDRAKPRPGMPLASRARIISELEGIVGKNAVDQALKTLADAGVIKKIKSVAPGQKNPVLSVEYSLCPEAFSPARDSRNRESRGVPDPGPDQGVPYNTYTSTKEKEAEAVHAAAAQHIPATAPSGKRRRTRPSGIVTWLLGDDAEAEQIEKWAAPEELAAAVQSVLSFGRDPVPGLVSREIERLRRRRESEAAAQARRAAASALPADPEAAARGRAFIESRRRLLQRSRAADTG